MTAISRRKFSAYSVSTLLSSAFMGSTPAFAWTPNRPLRLVIAYPAGGPTDVIARIIAQDITGPLGQNVIVENVPGASGALGTRQVARGEADGHLLTLGNNQTHGSNQFLMRSLGYDPQRDFAPLAGAGSFEHTFVVRNELPVRSIQDLVAMARANPGVLSYGSTGLGSGSHISTELLMVRTGIKMTHIPYRGAAPLVQDLVAGRIDVANSTLPSVLQQIKAGQLRAVALSSPQRNDSLPDLPTLREQGIVDADAESFAAFFAPVGTPEPALARLSTEIVASLRRPSIIEAISRIGFTLNPRGPDAFRAYHAAEMRVLEEVIRTARIQMDG